MSEENEPVVGQVDVVEDTTQDVTEDPIAVDVPVEEPKAKKAAKKKPIVKESPVKTTPVAKKTAKKTIKKETKLVKKSESKVKKVSQVSSGEQGIERSKDLPWNEKKVAVFKALKSLKAFDAMSAKSAKEVSAKTGGIADTTAVRHYCYHAKVSGLTGVHQIEGTRGYAFSLTKKGQGIDPVAELKKG